MQEVSYLAYGQGTQEISIEARFKDNVEMRAFLGRVLPAIPGVRVRATPWFRASCAISTNGSPGGKTSAAKKGKPVTGFSIV
jgi:hypothetical protein